jgi:hypothetical protein
MFKPHYYFLFFSILCCACNNSVEYQHAQNFSHADLGLSVPLKGVELDFGEMIVRPKCIAVIDTILVINNIGMEYFIHRYDIKNKKKIGESIPFGNGPEEMLSAQAFHISFDDTTVWILDAPKQKVNQYGKYDICFSDQPVPLFSVQFKDFFNQITVLPDGKILASTLNPERTHLSIYNMQGDLVHDNCDFPDAGITQTPYERMESFLGNMLFDVSTNRIFYAYMQTDLIDIFDTGGNLLYRTHGPDHFFPVMKQRNIGDEIKVSSQIGQTRDGYFSPVAYGNEVWTLYSGKYFEPPTPNYLLDHIIVFNWEGKPIRQYKLSVPIYTFTIDQKNNILYGITDDPEYRVIKFEI